jgi:hypothetical protein
MSTHAARPRRPPGARLQNGGHSAPLVTAFTGKLSIKYVRQSINFDPANIGKVLVS